VQVGGWLQKHELLAALDQPVAAVVEFDCIVVFVELEAVLHVPHFVEEPPQVGLLTQVFGEDRLVALELVEVYFVVVDLMQHLLGCLTFDRIFQQSHQE